MTGRGTGSGLKARQEKRSPSSSSSTPIRFSSSSRTRHPSFFGLVLTLNVDGRYRQVGAAPLLGRQGPIVTRRPHEHESSTHSTAFYHSLPHHRGYQRPHRPYAGGRLRKP